VALLTAFLLAGCAQAQEAEDSTGWVAYYNKRTTESWKVNGGGLYFGSGEGSEHYGSGVGSRFGLQGNYVGRFDEHGNFIRKGAEDRYKESWAESSNFQGQGSGDGGSGDEGDYAEEPTLPLLDPPPKATEAPTSAAAVATTKRAITKRTVVQVATTKTTKSVPQQMSVGAKEVLQPSKPRKNQPASKNIKNKKKRRRKLGPRLIHSQPPQ
jgi:hypothetical protein